MPPQVQPCCRAAAVAAAPGRRAAVQQQRRRVSVDVPQVCLHLQRACSDQSSAAHDYQMRMLHPSKFGEHHRCNKAPAHRIDTAKTVATRGIDPLAAHGNCLSKLEVAACNEDTEPTCARAFCENAETPPARCATRWKPAAAAAVAAPRGSDPPSSSSTFVGWC